MAINGNGKAAAITVGSVVAALIALGTLYSMVPDWMPRSEAQQAHAATDAKIERHTSSHGHGSVSREVSSNSARVTAVESEVQAMREENATFREEYRADQRELQGDIKALMRHQGVRSPSE